LDEFSREQAILAALRSTGRVAVTELSVRLGVSAVTVRKDLDALERRSLLRRVRGGAVGVGASDEGAFEIRLRDSRERKQAIAKAAAQLVQDGDVIAIDSSTTTFYLAQEILDRRNLVVVTNGLRLAMLLMEQSTARVLMPGGVLRRSAESLVGPIGDALSTRGRIAKGFSAEEASTKQGMASSCELVYGLFDSSKSYGFGLHSFVAPNNVAGLYTDDNAAQDFVNQWKQLSVPVTTVHVDPRTSEARQPNE
jgi:DeoR family transcriptional regulator of aga operon